MKLRQSACCLSAVIESPGQHPGQISPGFEGFEPARAAARRSDVPGWRQSRRWNPAIVRLLAGLLIGVLFPVAALAGQQSAQPKTPPSATAPLAPKTAAPATAPPAAAGAAPSAPSNAATPGAATPPAAGNAAATGAATPPPAGDAAAPQSPLAIQQQALALQEQNVQAQQQSFQQQEQALPPDQRAHLKPTAYHRAADTPEGLHPFAGDIGAALFYSVPGARSLDSFREHASRISVIAPQAFALDHRGDLHGSLPNGVLPVAVSHNVGIMPLVINADFSRWGAGRLLRNPAARDRAIAQLVDTARSLNLIGWQIDFENLPASDREVFTRFVHEVALALHRKGKLLSVAVAARTSEQHTDTWHTFSGVYDYAGLAASADFLSVMAYPEHDGSHPGPLASYPWVRQVIDHVLLSVPPDKLSLGLPTYQTDWGERRVRVTIIRRVGRRLRRFIRWVYRLVGHNGAADHGDQTLHWDPVLKSSYRIYWLHHRRHIVWVEDERSFKAKLQLVSQYHLYGFSVWRIGLEDPHIWSELPRAEHLVEAPAPAAPDHLPTLIDRTSQTSAGDPPSE